jgi:hypothetical protein
MLERESTAIQWLNRLSAMCLVNPLIKLHSAALNAPYFIILLCLINARQFYSPRGE